MGLWRQALRSIMGEELILWKIFISSFASFGDGMPFELYLGIKEIWIRLGQVHSNITILGSECRGSPCTSIALWSFSPVANSTLPIYMSETSPGFWGSSQKQGQWVEYNLWSWEPSQSCNTIHIPPSCMSWVENKTGLYKYELAYTPAQYIDL